MLLDACGGCNWPVAHVLERPRCQMFLDVAALLRGTPAAAACHAWVAIHGPGGAEGGTACADACAGGDTEGRRAENRTASGIPHAVPVETADGMSAGSARKAGFSNRGTAECGSAQGGSHAESDCASDGGGAEYGTVRVWLAELTAASLVKEVWPAVD
jgi:hypothetical protein